MIRRKILANGRIAAQQKNIPAKLGCSVVDTVIAHRWVQLNDMPVLVGRARVGRIWRLAFGEVGEHHIHAARRRVHLDVFRTIHWRRRKQARSEPRVDQHVSLLRETVLLDERTIAVHQRQPYQRAIALEPRHVERAVI